MSQISSHTPRGGARSFPVWDMPSSLPVISLADLARPRYCTPRHRNLDVIPRCGLKSTCLFVARTITDML